MRQMIMQRSTLIHLPITLAVIANLQQPILRIVPLAAVGANQIAAPGCAEVIVVFSDRESRPATAGDQKHSRRRGAFMFF